MNNIPLQPQMTFYSEIISSEEKKIIDESELKGDFKGRTVTNVPIKNYLKINYFGKNNLFNIEIKTLNKKDQEYANKAGLGLVNEEGRTGLFTTKNWKPLNLQTATGEQYTILVNVKQAITRLNLLGFSNEAAENIVKTGRLLDVMQKNGVEQYVKKFSADHSLPISLMLCDWISKGEISEDDIYALLNENANEFKHLDGNSFDDDVVTELKENFLLDKKITEKLKNYSIVNKNAVIKEIRNWISKSEISVEEIEGLFSSVLVKNCLKHEMAFISPKYDSQFPLNNLKEMYVFEKTANKLNFNELDSFKEIQKFSQNNHISYEELIKQVQKYAKEFQCTEKEALFVLIYVSDFKITPEDALSAIKSGCPANKVKSFLLRKKQQKATVVIERKFKEFTFRKKMTAQEERLTTANKRLNELKETKLYTVDVKTPEILKHTIDQLAVWHTVSDITFSKASEEGNKNLISQNHQINRLLFNTLENMEKNIKVMEKTNFKIILDDNKNIQASALYKIDEVRREGGKLKKIPLYISYISSAPWNLRVTETNDDTRKVEGAATALIESAIYESIKKGTKGAVALEAVYLAKDFYKKLGFVEKEWQPSETGLISMELSVENAKKFLVSSRAGRALPSEDPSPLTGS